MQPASGRRALRRRHVRTDAARASLQAGLVLAIAIAGASVVRSMNVAIHDAVGGAWPFCLAASCAKLP